MQPIESWELHLNLGRKYLKKKKYLQASEAFKQSLILRENFGSYQGLGWTLYNNKQFHQSINAFQRALLIEKNWDAYQGLGLSLFRVRKFQEAIEAFNKSLEIEEHWKTYSGLGWSLYNTKRLQQAAHAFYRSLEIQENTKSYQGLGWVYFQTRQYQKAIKAFNQSLEIEANPMSHNGVGWSYYHFRKFEPAINAFRQSLSFEENWNSYLGLGWSLFEDNQYQEAAKVFKKSLARQESWEAYLGLGQTLSKAQNYEAALESVFRSYCIKQLEATKNLFYKIWLERTHTEKSQDPLLDCLFKSNNQNKDSLTAILLKYISKESDGSYLNPLLIKMMSSIISTETLEKAQDVQQNIHECIENKRIALESQIEQVDLRNKVLFGTSHSRLYTECKEIEAIYVGAGTMYGINNPKSRSGHYHKILSRLETLDPQKTPIVLDFGEIDLRNNVIRQSRKQGKSPYEICNSSIYSLLEFIRPIKSQGFKIIVVGPHCGGGNIPNSSSSEIERNDICAYMNDKLAIECYKNEIYFCTLFDITVNQKTLRNTRNLYMDHCHLQLPLGNTNSTGIMLSNLASISVNKATKDFCKVNPPFQKSDIKSECTIIASNIPNWTNAKFTPGEIRQNGLFFTKDQQYMALIELPFGMDVKDVFLDFLGNYTSQSTDVKAINEIFDLSKETKRNNFIDSKIEAYKDGNLQSRKHFFNQKCPDGTTSRYLLITASSKSNGEQLTSIRISRWID